MGELLENAIFEYTAHRSCKDFVLCCWQDLTSVPLSLKHVKIEERERDRRKSSNPRFTLSWY